MRKTWIGNSRPSFPTHGHHWAPSPDNAACTTTTAAAAATVSPRHRQVYCTLSTAANRPQRPCAVQRWRPTRGPSQSAAPWLSPPTWWKCAAQPPWPAADWWTTRACASCCCGGTGCAGDGQWQSVSCRLDAVPRREWRGREGRVFEPVHQRRRQRRCDVGHRQLSVCNYEPDVAVSLADVCVHGSSERVVRHGPAVCGAASGGLAHDLGGCRPQRVQWSNVGVELDGRHTSHESELRRGLRRVGAGCAKVPLTQRACAVTRVWLLSRST